MQRLPRDQFAALVRDHHAAVHRSAARWVGAEAAADVTQDVFVRVLEGKLRLEAAHSVRATLCWLATRLAANRERSRSRRSRHEEHAMQPTAATDDDADDPARRALDADLHRAVAAELEALPPELRLPVQLHCQDELTFAAIGSELRVPTSTVHDRVRQGLQRLRTALAGRGFAIAGTGLPAVVGALPARAPGGLQDRLLALGGRAGVGAAGYGARLVLGVAAAATALAVAAFAWWPAAEAAQPAAGAAVGAVAAAPRESATDAVGDPAPAPPADRAAVEGELPALAVPGEIRVRTTSTFHGTVQDAGAWPVQGATVTAVAAGGLKPFALGSTVVDAHGAFRLELGPHTLYPEAVRLQVAECGRLLLETDELALPRAASAEPLALVLPAAVGTALSRYELSVAVVGPDGLPLPGVPITLQADATPPPRPAGGAVEAEGTTGGDGMAVLRGRSLGGKWLFVDGRGAGLASQFVTMPLDRPGAHRRQIALARGGRIEVHLRTVDGELLPWASAWLEHATSGLQLSAALGADGTVVFSGLADGEYTLHVTADAQLSPVQVAGLRPNGAPLEVRLKQRTDLRDVGDHMAEVHGELIDAASGQVVEFGAFEVDVVALRAGASTLPSDRLVPRGPAQQLDGGDRFVAFHEVALTAGRWAVVAKVPGFATAVVELELRDHEVRTGVRVPLHRGGELSGRVLDPAGRPVPQVIVFPVGIGALADRIVAAWSAPADDRGAPPSVAAAAAWTDADGHFVLSGVPPGVEFRLLASQRGGGCATSAPFLVRDGERLGDVELRLAGR